MTTNIAFDTLNYAEMLRASGVANPEAHSAGLAHALSQNTYTKTETDNMIDAALKQFEARTQQMQLEMKEIENRFERSIQTAIRTAVNDSVNRLTRNIGIISTLLALVASAVHYIH